MTNISENRKVLEISEEGTDWGLEHLQHKYLAIYPDGNTDKLPLLGTQKRKLARKTDNFIELVEPLEQDIVVCGGQTKLRLHSAGAGYMYPAMSNATIPSLNVNKGPSD